ncbi:TonB family protein [Inhella sp.]|uniref:TonB family protein n=1 Tax=Inhella sp. TaxID=1921806 RepID=UPI0035B03810
MREAARQAHRSPLVTVAIRRDGTVESVVFVTSSGVPALDEAVRRAVLQLAPYPPFPPLLAASYDVVEIRRSWSFSSGVWLQ